MSPARRRPWPLAALVLALILGAGADPAAAQIRRPVRWIVVPESDVWLLAIATPAAARLAHNNTPPVLVLAPVLETDPVIDWRRQLVARECLVLSSGDDQKFHAAVARLPVETLKTGTDPMQAGIAVARHVWGKCDDVVAALTSDAAGLIRATTLAAHLRAPFVPIQSPDDLPGLLAALRPLAVKRVRVVAVSRKLDAPRPTPGLARVEVLAGPAADRMVVERIGRDHIHNIIVTRTPEDADADDAPAWIAPYLSLYRAAPVVLTDKDDPRAAETAVNDLVRTHRLQPRNITLLAGYADVGVYVVRDQANLDEYDMEVEPFSTPTPGRAVPFGVGRIPFPLLTAAAVIGRGVVKERTVRRDAERVLMVANPNTENVALPFCETVSRATGAEFHNLAVPIDEFYHVPSNDAKAADCARKARLIIYEGHIYDQELLPLDKDLAFADHEEDVEVVADGDDPRAPTTHKPKPEARPPHKVLEGFPIVILQSCNSLDEPIAEYLFQYGGVGMIGSVTNIHSASGSSFVKALADGLLYRDATVGEALRDARNYFLCLAALKQLRGHREQAKAYRVAMSFRFWGDPELKVFDAAPRQPKLAPVSAELIAETGVRVTMPSRPMPDVATAKYVMKRFPGSQSAGIVKRVPGRDAREMMPLYFFRFSVSPSFAGKRYTRVAYRNNDKPGAVLLVDGLGRFVYVLFFPPSAEADQTFDLPFER